MCLLPGGLGSHCGMRDGEHPALAPAAWTSLVVLHRIQLCPSLPPCAGVTRPRGETVPWLGRSAVGGHGGQGSSRCCSRSARQPSRAGGRAAAAGDVCVCVRARAQRGHQTQLYCSCEPGRVTGVVKMPLLSVSLCSAAAGG